MSLISIFHFIIFLFSVSLNLTKNQQHESTVIKLIFAEILQIPCSVKKKMLYQISGKCLKFGTSLDFVF